MSLASHHFLKASKIDLSFSLSEIDHKQNLYMNSCKRLELSCPEVEKIREKYQKQYHRFQKAHHSRSKSQMQKINRIIKDASDLNEILVDADRWLQKSKQKKEKQLLEGKRSFHEIPMKQNSRIRWRNTVNNQ